MMDIMSDVAINLENTCKNRVSSRRITDNA